jgi:ATP-dependent Lhr-like helicase
MSSENSATEEWAWQLLRRWGVVFRDLLVCETGAPSWYALLQVLRRLEARGEIRGGRFVSGVAGEQFATAESVQQLRLMRDEIPSSDYIVISAADPLNLVGVLTPHERIPRIAGSRIVLRAGVPVSSIHGGEIRNFSNVPAEWIAEALPYLSERVVQRS